MFVKTKPLFDKTKALFIKTVALINVLVTVKSSLPLEKVQINLVVHSLIRTFAAEKAKEC
jgi:hypothetical protein